MELDIGSNIVRNTNGVLLVDDRQQIELEVGEDGQALLTMDVYSSNGDRMAKLRRNAWVTNDEDRFAIDTNPDALQLTDRTTDEVVLEVNVVSRTSLRIPRGHFYSHQGHEIRIEPDFLRIMGVTMMSNTIEGGNQAIALGSGSMGLGNV